MSARGLRNFCIPCYVYFCTCTSGLEAAILDFPMHSNTNNKDISSTSSLWQAELTFIDN